MSPWRGLQSSAKNANSLDLAKTWEKHADDRENFVLTHPELHAQMTAAEKPKPAP